MIWSGVVLGMLFSMATYNALGRALAALVGIFAPGNDLLLQLAAVIAQIVAGIYAWRALRQAFAGGLAAFWTSQPGRWIVGRLLDAGILLLLLKPASIAAGLVVYLGLSAWVSLGGAFNQGVAVTVVFAGYGLTLLFAWKPRRCMKIFLGKASRPLRRVWRTLPMGNGGSARFAGPLEEWSHPWKPGRLMLGASMYDGKWIVGIADDRHACLIATNRSGKGRACITGNLLTWP
jgi:hypothetical protein